MNFLLIVAFLVLAFQIYLYFFNKGKVKKQKNDVLARYNIHSVKDAWRIINDHNIPEDDRRRIEDLYEKGAI